MFKRLRNLVRQVRDTVKFVAKALTRSLYSVFKKAKRPAEVPMEVRRIKVAELPDTTPIELDVRIIHAPNDRRNRKKAVLLLHGFPEYWGVWQPQLKALRDAGYTLIVPDQRGYNLSSKPPTDDIGTWYTLDHLADDAIAVLDALHKQEGLPTDKDVLLVGHDFGGAVSWWLGMKYPDRFERLFIASMPHLKAFFNAWEYHPEQGYDSRYIGGFLTTQYGPNLARWSHGQLFASVLQCNSEFGTFDAHNLMPFRVAWTQGAESSPDAPEAMMCWYKALETSFRKWKADPNGFQWPGGNGGIVEVPTLIADGRNDAFFINELVVPSKKLCRSMDHRGLPSAGVTLGSTSHWLFWDNPDSFNNRLLLPWLNDGTVLPDALTDNQTIDYDWIEEQAPGFKKLLRETRREYASEEAAVNAAVARAVESTELGRAEEARYEEAERALADAAKAA